MHTPKLKSIAKPFIMKLKSLLAILALASLPLFLNSCLDGCRLVTCENGGECVDGDCECEPGYGGSTCQDVIDACLAENIECQNGGTCVNGECDCPPGWIGERCAISTTGGGGDDCDGVTCLNGGTCVDGTCDCPDGFSGASCENEDLCITQNVTCENGNCVDGECECDANWAGPQCDVYCVNGTYDGSGGCDCDNGYEGNGCDTEVRAKFLGFYTMGGNISCPSGSGALNPFNIDVTNGTTIDRITITMFGTLDIPAIVSGNTFTMVETTNPANGYVYAGNGSISGSTLSMLFTQYNPTVPETCTIDAVSQ